MRSLLVVLVLAAPTAVALLPADPEEPRAAASLRLHQRVFWDGPFVEQGGARVDALDSVACDGATGHMYACGAVATPPFAVGSLFCPDRAWCVEYAIDVLDGGGTLRVALDTPSASDKFDIWMVPPGGTPREPYAMGALDGQAQGCGCYSMEARAQDAAPGRYVVQVLFYDVEQASFRMRAYLEAPEPPAPHPQPLLPNIRSVPPFELALMDCQLGETLETGAQRCLRFASGPANVGRGPVDLRMRETGLTGPVAQRVHWSDGSWHEIPAGTFEYHEAHAHYHHAAMGGFELWRVVDEATGEMDLVGPGPKIGVCMLDVLLPEWRSFAQEARGTWEGSCATSMVPGIASLQDVPSFGLTQGWADIYTYWTEGNYVDVTGQPDGLYVVRVTSDAGGTILETDESDNAAYALVRLVAHDIDVLERGHGASPWDPAKELADDIRRPTA